MINIKNRNQKMYYLPSVKNTILYFFLFPVIILSALMSYYQIAFLLLGLVIVYLIFKIPEIGFSLFLLIPIIKEITQNFPIDLTLLLFLLTSLSMIYKLYTKKYKIDILNKYVLFYTLFVLMVIFSLIYTKSPNYGLNKSMTFAVFTSFLFIGGICLGLSETTRIRFLNILHIIIFIYGLVYVYFLKDLLSMNFAAFAQYHLRLHLVGNPIAVSRTFSVLTIISIIFLSFEQNRVTKVYHYLSIAIGLFISIATNSRGPFIALLITILFYFFIFSKIKLSIILKYVFLISVLLIVIFTVLPESFISRYKIMGEKEIHVTSKRVDVVNTFKTRENFIAQSFEYIKNNPEKLMFGIGSGGFSNISVSTDTRIYPHNIFVEIILEFGIISLLLFLSPFLLIISEYIFLKKNVSTNENISIIIWIVIFFFFFLNAQVSGSINGNRILWFFQGGVVGSLIAIQNKKYENIKLQA